MLQRLLAILVLSGVLFLAAYLGQQGATPGLVDSPDGISILQDDRQASRQAVAAKAGDALAEEEAEDEEPKDYWEPIPFDRRNFEEVRTYVREKYIEGVVDESRAFAEAASFALASDEDGGYLILPVGFYEKRKGEPLEEGRLRGAKHMLSPSDKFVLLEIVEPLEKESPSKRLSDDEIRELRKEDEGRTRLLDTEWRKAGFSSRDFDRIMAFLARQTPKSPAGKGKKGKGKAKRGWPMKTAWVAAANGYLYSLDPHSALIPAEAWKDSTQELTDASFEGIGAILTRRHDSDYTIVESPIDGQPAVKAGLRAGDVIIKVDDKDIKDMLLPKVVSLIKGPKGTKVVLTVEREGMPEPVEVPIIRSRIDIKNVQGRILKDYDDIGYAKITGFVPTTNLEMGRMFRELNRQVKSGKLSGIVLDLRRNSGGLLRQGIKIADRFLRSGTIVTVKSRGEDDEVHEATSHGTWDLPMVLLVDDGSASASEIVASALQDGGRAVVVGDRTFGKASVQTLFSPMLRDDYYIKLTVARYFSPSGRTLQVVGVNPDVEVAPEIDGEMPLGFREENLSHHLAALNTKYKSANEDWARSLVTCADGQGRARQIFKSNPNPAVRFDYPVMRAADLIQCMHKSGRTSAPPAPPALRPNYGKSKR